MTGTPVQQRRTKGWRKPDGAISVARPHKWDNPFVVGEHGIRTAASGSGRQPVQGRHHDLLRRVAFKLLRSPLSFTNRLGTSPAVRKDTYESCGGSCGARPFQTFSGSVGGAVVEDGHRPPLNVSANAARTQSERHCQRQTERLEHER